MRQYLWSVLLLFLAFSTLSYGQTPESITIGSKAFPDSWV